MEKKKVDKKEVLKKGNKIVTEFKEFIARGNVVELAVGVIIGSAFGKIVSSLVSDILMPVIGMISGGVDFSGLSFTIQDATIQYGMFIQNIIDFLIIAICVFIFVKVIEKMTKKKEEIVEEKIEVQKDETIVLLEEIRDLLQAKTKAEKESAKEEENLEIEEKEA